tara:strand:- start:3895 stop:4419 length:525 start_codon:yes stop_codon:yes gene_type:complete
MGLDISTSITGITILDKTGKVVICNAWDLRKYKGFFLKVEKTKVFLEEVAQNQEIKKIFIEQSLQSFRTGFSSAQTLSTLARFNGTLSWLCYEMFSLEPEFVGATTARKLCGIKVPRGRKAKEVVLENILDIDPNFVIEYTKHGNPKPGTYDRADSLVIARAGLELCKQESLNS